MKIALLLCLLAITAAHAQTKPADRSNTILVQMPDSGFVAWQRVAQALVSRGYPIKDSNKDLLTVTGGPKTIKRAGEILVSAALNGHVVALYGTFNDNENSTPLRITYRGMKGSPFIIAWDELSAVAKSLGKDIRYEVRP